MRDICPMWKRRRQCKPGTSGTSAASFSVYTDLSLISSYIYQLYSIFRFIFRFFLKYFTFHSQDHGRMGNIIQKRMMGMTLQDTKEEQPVERENILSDFRTYLELHNMAENTIHAYLHAVGQFLDMYSQISHDTLLLYKCYLMEHYKPQTVNQRIRAMNCFVESLHLTEAHVIMVRVQQKSFLENVISQADYEYLKKCLLRDGDHLYYYTIRVMAATGMRVSELIRLQVNDVKRGYMDLYSKDNKIRRIYIPKSVQKDCLRWLKQIGRTDGYVFLNRYGDPITTAGIRGQLKKIAIRYGLDPSVVYPHSFRHLFAKNFIETCGDISMLSDILGHESIETTRIYLHRSSTEQKEIVNQIVDW